MGFGLKRATQRSQRLQQGLDAEISGQFDRSWVGVIGALRGIDMVIGVQVLVLAFGQPQKLQRSIGNDFIGIHIGRSTRPALNHIADELLVQPPCYQLITSLGNSLRLLFWNHTQLQIGVRCRFFHHTKSANQIRHFAELVPSDRKVFHGSGRVYAPISGIGDRHGAEEVVFLAHGAYSLSRAKRGQAAV